VPLLAAGALVASCAGSGPDPGNRRLHALAADPIFARLPRGGVRTSWQETPAKYRATGIGVGGIWDEPSVTLTFTSTQSVDDVYRFYAQRAVEAGWTPYRKLPNGLPQSWAKQIDGKPSGIILIPIGTSLQEATP
jgi:hypothetical protein